MEEINSKKMDYKYDTLDTFIIVTTKWIRTNEFSINHILMGYLHKFSSSVFYYFGIFIYIFFYENYI